jgi:uncharacterized protein (TIGR00251 family)
MLSSGAKRANKFRLSHDWSVTVSFFTTKSPNKRTYATSRRTEVIDPFAQRTALITHRRYSERMATLRFHIVANAKETKVVGEHGDAIKIKLRAPAVEGKANAALRSFLAERLNISERAIVLERGKKSRDKVIRIDGLSDEDALRRLSPTTNWK